MSKREKGITVVAYTKKNLEENTVTEAGKNPRW